MKLFASYIPGTDGNLAVWLGTYKEKLGLLGPGLGLTPAEIGEQQDAAQSIIDSINKADLKKVEMMESTTAKELVKQRNLQLIRTMAFRVKKSAPYTTNIGRELGIIATTQTIDINGLKPVIGPVSFHGYVSIGFNKQRVFGISLYSRLKGQLEWQPLGVARTSPFVDDTPLTEEGKPETREYMARCYDGLDEMGYPSDIVTIVHG
jgi:hypothetical protein